MNAHPELQHIEEAASELLVDPSFVEKDWYATHTLSLLSMLNIGSNKIVFGGGTSLSKGYGLIERFSEDIDIVIIGEPEPNRPERREIREKILDQLRSSQVINVVEESLKSLDASRQFKVEIKYPRKLQLHGSLRRNLKLEAIFQKRDLATENKEINTIVGTVGAEKAEFSLECVSPVETAADKLCALTWRVLNKDRSQKLGTINNEPQMIRHLHDLSALNKLVTNDSEFISLCRERMKGDLVRAKQQEKHSVKSALESAIKSLETDGVYESEYSKFVKDMSYAKEDSKIGYRDAIDSYQALAKLIIKTA